MVLSICDELERSSHVKEVLMMLYVQLTHLRKSRTLKQGPTQSSCY